MEGFYDLSFEELMFRRKLRKGIRNTWKHGKYVNLYGKHKVIRKESIFLITVCILYFVIILDQTEFRAILRLKDLNYERLFLIFSITIILLVFKKWLYEYFITEIYDFIIYPSYSSYKI